MKSRKPYKNSGFGDTTPKDMFFFRAVPETTAFIVVSGTHTRVELAHVPETTSFIVVSGT